MDFITGQLRENGLADSPAGDSQMSSAIESALAGYTAKRLPPVVTCLQNPNPCPCLFGRLGMICAIAKSSSLHPCREMRVMKKSATTNGCIMVHLNLNSSQSMHYESWVVPAGVPFASAEIFGAELGPIIDFVLERGGGC